MSKRRLVNRCLMGAVLAVPSALLGIYSLGYAQEPPAGTSLYQPAPVLRIAQADPEPAADKSDLAKWDVPGGMALDPDAKKRLYLGLADSCINCHTRNTAPPAPNAPQIRIPGFPVVTNDGWALLNESYTWAGQDKHYGSYAVLLNDRSKRMAQILKIVDDEGNSIIHRDLRCIACHSGMPIYEMKRDEGRPGMIDESMVQDKRLSFGVSCEGCHGSAGDADSNDKIKSWVSIHTSKTEWRYKDPHTKADEYGYFDVRSPVSRSRMCLSCHVGNVHEGRVVTHEMYAAGHPPLPGFDVETFSQQEPAHWRNFHEKPKKIRDEFLESTKTWRTTEWNETDLHNTRDLLIGVLVNLSEMLKLNANLADSDVKIPIGSKTWQSDGSQQWPELAQFACYACHHDLRGDGWRIQRTPIGVPGRPPLQEWPFALTKLAVKSTGSNHEELLTLIEKVKQAGVDGPFGNREDLKTLGPKLAAQLDAVAKELEQRNIPREAAQPLLLDLIELAEKETLDYDSARQLVWAFRVIYDDWKRDPNDKKDFFEIKKIDEVPGWYSATDNLTGVKQILAGFEADILLDLRKGRSTIGTVGQGEENERLVLEWEPQKALPKIGSYNPETVRNKLMELKPMLMK